jgi:hypothetical protein
MSIIMPRANMMSVIRKLGLTQGLKLCLDAGDEASYSGSGQTWNDVSGNGHHFYRGATSGSESSDPTFNGTAGRRSKDEYLSFDGGDFCRLAASNPAWLQNAHKTGAKFGFAMWAYIPTLSVWYSLFGNSGHTLAGVGIAPFVNDANDGIFFQILNGSGSSLTLSQGGVSNAVTTGWNFLAASYDAAIGAGGMVFQTNNTRGTADSTLSSPSSGNASQTLDIGARGNGNQPSPNGFRVANQVMWEGVAHLKYELAALFQATRGKFGL